MKRFLIALLVSVFWLTPAQAWYKRYKNAAEVLHDHAVWWGLQYRRVKIVRIDPKTMEYPKPWIKEPLPADLPRMTRQFIVDVNAYETMRIADGIEPDVERITLLRCRPQYWDERFMPWPYYLYVGSIQRVCDF